MRGLLVLVIALAACGRLSFDPRTDAREDGTVDVAMLAEHDEDGDGIDDAIDFCPVEPGPQIDSDGDGVGDVCDPEPSKPDQRVLVFNDGRTTNGITLLGFSGTWTTGNDSHSFRGPGADINVGPAPYSGIQIVIGFDIVNILGGATAQHQISVHASDSTGAFHDFVELNEYNDTYRALSITRLDGAGYTTLVDDAFAGTLHTGFVQMATQAFPTGEMIAFAGWPGETYAANWPTSNHAPASNVIISFFNVEVDVRYLWIVTW